MILRLALSLPRQVYTVVSNNIPFLFIYFWGRGNGFLRNRTSGEHCPGVFEKKQCHVIWDKSSFYDHLGAFSKKKNGHVVQNKWTTAIATTTNNRYWKRWKTFRYVELFSGNQRDRGICAICRGRDSDVDKPVPEVWLITLEEALLLIHLATITKPKVEQQCMESEHLLNTLLMYTYVLMRN